MNNCYHARDKPLALFFAPNHTPIFKNHILFNRKDHLYYENF